MLERVCWWECKLAQPPQRTVWRFLKEIQSRPTIWSSNPTPVHISGEKHTLEISMYPIVHCSSIYNRQDMVAVLMSINRGMGREDVLLIYNGILLSLGKEWNNAIFNNMDDYHAKWSKTGRERQISYDIIYMWHLKNEFISKTERDSQLQTTNLWLPKGKGGGEGWTRNLRLTYTHYYI